MFGLPVGTLALVVGFPLLWILYTIAFLVLTRDWRARRGRVVNGTVIAFLVLYYLVVLGIGLWAMRRGAGDDLEGYLLGGRQVGPLVTALTLQSTSMSGFMFLGAGSLAYTTGYWSLWFAAGDIGGGVLNLSVIGRRMRKLSQMMGSLTPIEYLEARYPSPLTRLIAAGLSVFLLAFYALAQFIAGGKGMALVTGLDYEWALLIALTIITIYTLLGGYLAVAYTDLFQSLVMLVGVVWILSAALAHVGGFTAANQALAGLDPTILSIWGRGLEFEGQWGGRRGRSPRVLGRADGLAARRLASPGDATPGDGATRGGLRHRLERPVRLVALSGRDPRHPDPAGPRRSGAGDLRGGPDAAAPGGHRHRDGRHHGRHHVHGGLAAPPDRLDRVA